MNVFRQLNKGAQPRAPDFQNCGGGGGRAHVLRGRSPKIFIQCQVFLIISIFFNDIFEDMYFIWQLFRD
jgi:hypothetical protein